MIKSIDHFVAEAEQKFFTCKDLVSLENAKAYYFGKNGCFTYLFRELKGLNTNEKKILGKQINQSKRAIKLLLSKHRQFLTEIAIKKELESDAIDVTLPGRGLSLGSIHPIMQSWKRIEEIFYSFGFDSVDGPEVETDWINFTALNNSPNHPARSMQDTFYLDMYDSDGLPLLLRTHTSSMQVRYARTNKPPIKIISPGKTYRIDHDAMHSPMFHQIEGLWISEKLSFSDLKGIYTNFLYRFFENQDLEIRFRSSFFPFTEPSAEIDVIFMKGKNRNRWLEISGCGQVHPKVMRNFGLNPEHYIGFAFGSGLERLTMLRYGISDLRKFYEGDLRFSHQFNM